MIKVIELGAGGCLGMSILPQNRRFYVLFEELAGCLVVTSEALVEMLTNYEDVASKAEHLKDLEHEADNVTHELYRLTHQTFVTPFDREDIAALTQRLDDVVDFVEASGTVMNVYSITAPTEDSIQLAKIAHQQCVLVQTAIAALRTGKLKGILDQIHEINTLENEADVIFRSAMSELFKDHMDTLEVIKWRDVYDLLERATDSCEAVSHALEGIVLKHA